MRTSHLICMMLLLGFCLSAELNFMKKPYDFLDKIVMLAWKPLLNFIIFLPLKPIICNLFSSKLIELSKLPNNLTAEKANEECQKGIEMFVD